MGTQVSTKVLVIEDDAAINDVVCSTLRGKGYECVPAYSGTEAQLLNSQDAGQFDLIICDLMLPGLSGEEVVASIRNHSSVPILVISAKATVADRVTLLRQGVDDYLVKPFDLDELVARAEALLRRARQNTGGFFEGESPFESDGCSRSERDALLKGQSCHGATESSTLRFGRWALSENRRRFEVDGELVRLTRTEFDIVATLMKYSRKVFTKRELYGSVWREEAFVEEKAINTHISNIRTKLKKTGTDSYIETVWGIGFKLSDSVQMD